MTARDALEQPNSAAVLGLSVPVSALKRFVTYLLLNQEN